MSDYMNDLMDEWGLDFHAFINQYGTPAIWRSNRKNFDSQTGSAIYEYYDKPIKLIYNVFISSGFAQKKANRLPNDAIKIAVLENIQNDDIIFVDGDEWVVENSTSALKYNNPDKMIYVCAVLKKKIPSAGNNY